MQPTEHTANNIIPQTADCTVERCMYTILVSSGGKLNGRNLSTKTCNSLCYFYHFCGPLSSGAHRTHHLSHRRGHDHGNAKRQTVRTQLELWLVAPEQVAHNRRHKIIRYIYDDITKCTLTAAAEAGCGTRILEKHRPQIVHTHSDHTHRKRHAHRTTNREEIVLSQKKPARKQITRVADARTSVRKLAVKRPCGGAIVATSQTSVPACCRFLHTHSPRKSSPRRKRV